MLSYNNISFSDLSLEYSPWILDFFAFSSLLQAFSHASKKSVFLLTLETNSPQFFSKISIKLSLLIFSQFLSKLQVIQTFFQVKNQKLSSVFDFSL